MFILTIFLRPLPDSWRIASRFLIACRCSRMVSKHTPSDLNLSETYRSVLNSSLYQLKIRPRNGSDVSGAVNHAIMLNGLWELRQRSRSRFGRNSFDLRGHDWSCGWNEVSVQFLGEILVFLFFFAYYKSKLWGCGETIISQGWPRPTEYIQPAHNMGRSLDLSPTQR